MDFISSSKDLMNHIANMDRNNSVFQFSIAGKGKFTLVLQEESVNSIEEDAKNNSTLTQMIQDSQSEYKQGKSLTTSDLVESLSSEDFK